MKLIFVFIIILIVFQGFVTIDLISPIHAQGLTLDHIKTNLLENPPATGDPVLREQTILALDDILKNDSSRISPSVADFYASMVEKVKNEIDEEVLEGVNIWMMYNHGFIVKTPEIVFAFDLIDGYREWKKNGRQYKLPTELIQKINVLFISHSHGDHEDGSVILTVKNNGGYVIWDSEENSFTVSGLHVKRHYGLHSVPNRIFEVTTPEGFKIVHTGDNQRQTSGEYKIPLGPICPFKILIGWKAER
jgi:hypothetical protein